MSTFRKPPFWIALACAGLYLPTLGFGFVWDDLNNLVEHQRLQSWDALGAVFLKPAMWSAGVDAGAPPTYRPLSLASFVVDFHAFGGAAWGYHLGSVVLFVAAQLAVYLALRVWLTPAAAGAVALLCAVHPFSVPAAGWINGRSELLAMLFGCLALRGAAEEPRPLRLVWVGVTLLLAMLGKESGLVFVALAVFVAATSTGELDLRRGLGVASAGALAVLTWLGLRAVALEGTVPLTHPGDPARLLLSAPALLFRGLQAVVAPVDRAPVPLKTWLDGLSQLELWGYAAAFACVLAAIGWALHRRRYVVVVGLAWWFGAQAAVPLLAVVEWPGHYRWLYVGLPGLALALYDLGRARLRGPLPAVAIALLFTGLTWRALPSWRSSAELYATMYEEHPDSSYAALGVAVESAALGAWAQARELAFRAHELGSRRPLLYSVVATASARLGRCAEARAALRGRADPPSPHRAAALAAIEACRGP